MSLRTYVSLQATVGFNNTLDDTAFERAIEETLDTTEDVEVKTVTIPANTTDQAVSFGNVTEARLIYIEADGTLDFTVNGPGTGRTRIDKMVAPTSTQAPNLCAYALLTAKATTLHFTNPSTTTAVRAKVCIVGNLTA